MEMVCVNSGTWFSEDETLFFFWNDLLRNFGFNFWMKR